MSNYPDKQTLIQRAAARAEVSSEAAAAVIEAFLDEIYQAIKSGKPVNLRNFGTFYVRPEPSSWVFKFTPSQKWRKLFSWSSTYKGDL